MKVQAILDQNTISGFIVLESPADLEVALVHKYIQGAATKIIPLTSFTIQGKKGINEILVLNPFYAEDLYLVINGAEHQVLYGNTEKSLGENPINDRVYTTRDIPEIEDTVVAAPEFQNEVQSFEDLVCHSELQSLVSLVNLVCPQASISADRAIASISTTEVVTISTQVLDIDSHPKITIYLQCKSDPSAARVVLINARGQERVVSLNTSYRVGDYYCFSQLLTSSTKNAMVEIDFKPDGGYVAFAITDFGVLKLPQFTIPAPSGRALPTLHLRTYGSNMLAFELERMPHFGLQNLIDLVECGNGVRLQLSNRKIRISKMLDGSVVSVVETPQVGDSFSIYLDKNTAVVYDGNDEIKRVIGDFSVPLMDREFIIGGNPTDPDFDLNSRILKLDLFDHNFIG